MTFAERLVGGRVHYAWIVAGVTFLILLTAAAIRATPGFLIVPLEQAFGWSRATISFAVSAVIWTTIGWPPSPTWARRWSGRSG